jgi:hypothetical protein
VCPVRPLGNKQRRRRQRWCPPRRGPPRRWILGLRWRRTTDGGERAWGIAGEQPSQDRAACELCVCCPVHRSNWTARNTLPAGATPAIRRTSPSLQPVCLARRPGLGPLQPHLRPYQPQAAPPLQRLRGRVRLLLPSRRQLLVASPLGLPPQQRAPALPRPTLSSLLPRVRLLPPLPRPPSLGPLPLLCLLLRLPPLRAGFLLALRAPPPPSSPPLSAHPHRPLRHRGLEALLASVGLSLRPPQAPPCSRWWARRAGP